MITKDKQGRKYARLGQLVAGSRVKVDGDFACIEPWTEQIVERDADGLFIQCEEGHHYLDGCCGHGSDHLLGVYLAGDA